MKYDEMRLFCVFLVQKVCWMYVSVLTSLGIISSTVIHFDRISRDCWRDSGIPISGNTESQSGKEQHNSFYSKYIKATNLYFLFDCFSNFSKVDNV